MVQIIYIMNNGILQLSNTRYDDGVFNILRSHCQLVSNSQLHRLEIPKDCSTCPFPRSLDVCWLKLTCSIASISPFFAGPGMTTLRWEPIASAILSQFWVGWNYGGSFCIDKKKHCCFTMSRTSWSFAGYNLQLEQVIIKLLLFSRWGHRCHYKCLAVQNAPSLMKTSELFQDDSSVTLPRCHVPRSSADQFPHPHYFKHDRLRLFIGVYRKFRQKN